MEEVDSDTDLYTVVYGNECKCEATHHKLNPVCSVEVVALYVRTCMGLRWQICQNSVNYVETVVLRMGPCRKCNNPECVKILRI